MGSGYGIPRRDKRAVADGGACEARHLVYGALEHLARHPHNLDDGEDILCSRQKRILI